MLCYISSMVPAASPLQPSAAKALMAFLSEQQNPVVVLRADELDPALTTQPLWQELTVAHSSLSQSSQQHVALLRWCDVAPTHGWYEPVLSACISMYDLGAFSKPTSGFHSFRSSVDAAAEELVANRWKDAANSPPPAVVRVSAQYILHELPLMLSGVVHRGVHHRSITVPGLFPGKLHSLLCAVHHESCMASVRAELETTGARWALPSIVSIIE
jgi:hypothetical protein